MSVGDSSEDDDQAPLAQPPEDGGSVNPAAADMVLRAEDMVYSEWGFLGTKSTTKMTGAPARDRRASMFVTTSPILGFFLIGGTVVCVGHTVVGMALAGGGAGIVLLIRWFENR